MDIEFTVKNMLNKYGDGYNDPFRIAKNMDFIILKKDLGSTNGFYYHYKRNNIIGINYNLSEKEQKRVCAHELGHFALHKGINYSFLCKNAFFSSSKYEKEADLFAINLLLSNFDKEELTNLNIERISYITTYPVKYLSYIFSNMPI